MVLKEEIARNFSDVTYPGDDALFSLDCLRDPDAISYKEAIQGKSWREAIPVLMMSYHANTIWLLTPAAYHYYLPGYMLGLLQFGFEQYVAEVFFDTLPPGSMTRSKLAEVASIMTAQQLETVKHFLEYVVNNFEGSTESEAAIEALSAYWG